MPRKKSGGGVGEHREAGREPVEPAVAAAMRLDCPSAIRLMVDSTVESPTSQTVGQIALLISLVTGVPT